MFFILFFIYLVIFDLFIYFIFLFYSNRNGKWRWWPQTSLLLKKTSNISILPEQFTKKYSKLFEGILKKLRRAPEHSTKNVVLPYLSCLTNENHSPSTIRIFFSIIKITLLGSYVITLDKYISNLDKKYIKKIFCFSHNKKLPFS